MIEYLDTYHYDISELSEYSIVFDEFNPHYTGDINTDVSFCVRMLNKAKTALRLRKYLYFNELLHMFDEPPLAGSGNDSGWSLVKDPNAKLCEHMEVMPDGQIFITLHPMDDITPFTPYPSTVVGKDTVSFDRCQADLNAMDMADLINDIVEKYNECGNNYAALGHAVYNIISQQDDWLEHSIVVDPGTLVTG